MGKPYIYKALYQSSRSGRILFKWYYKKERKGKGALSNYIEQKATENCGAVSLALIDIRGTDQPSDDSQLYQIYL